MKMVIKADHKEVSSLMLRVSGLGVSVGRL